MAESAEWPSDAERGLTEAPDGFNTLEPPKISIRELEEPLRSVVRYLQNMRKCTNWLRCLNADLLDGHHASDFVLAANASSGDVVGPASATDTAIVLFDGTTGKLIKNSPVTVDGSGNVSGVGTVDGRDLAADGGKLDNIEDNATADQTGAEIKALYEAEADTNAFTDLEKTKLTGIETGATADQSDAEIETAYNNQVSVVSQAEAEAGTSTTVRRWTAERVAQAIAALAGSGGYWGKTGTTLSPSTSGDDIEVDGVAAFGTATVSALVGLNVGFDAATGSDDQSASRASAVSVSGHTGDINAAVFATTIQGTDNQNNARGGVMNVDNDSTGGTKGKIAGFELNIDSGASGSTVTTLRGIDVTVENTGGATHTTAQGVRVDMQDAATTVVGMDTRVSDGAHTFGSALRAFLLSGVTISGMMQAIYAQDSEQHASGRSAAIATNRDIAWVTNELTRPYARMRGDGTDTVILEEYDGTAAHFESMGRVIANEGFQPKVVVLTTDGATHNGAWGEHVIVNYTGSGTTGITINIPEAAPTTAGENAGLVFTVEVHDVGSGPINVTCQPSGSDALKSAGTAYASWDSNAVETIQVFRAGYERTVYGECCDNGGGYVVIPE